MSSSSTGNIGGAVEGLGGAFEGLGSAVEELEDCGSAELSTGGMVGGGAGLLTGETAKGGAELLTSGTAGGRGGAEFSARWHGWRWC